MNNKRKSIFRPATVSLAQSLRAKRARRQDSNQVFIDRVDLPSTCQRPDVPKSFSLEDVKSTLRMPDSYPEEEAEGGDVFEEAEGGGDGLNSPQGRDMLEPTAKGTSGQPRARRTVRSRYPNIEWKSKYRATFLDQVMRGKGRGDARKQAHCSDCKGKPLEDEPQDLERDRSAEYRCRDCFLQDLVCAKCCVRHHWNTPFHRIERWDGKRFGRSMLAELGLVIQLQHTSGFCTHPKECYRHLLVIHTNGIHRVKLQFCGCSRAREQYVQLLQRRLYPTNIKKGRISTAITFQCLETLQLQTLTTKGSIYDFYRALERLTDNSGMSPPPSRYRQLLRGIRQWRHLKLLMRAGQGQEVLSSNIDNAPERVLTLKCPSCPHPGINLPKGWETLAKGSDAYVTNCVPFAALTKQKTKFSKGLRYTGVVGVVCGRSDMLVKVGNLNKGERFSVIDYVLGMAMQLWPTILALLLCYDIACQYFRRFDRRKQAWPVRICLSAALWIVVAIGKLHHPGHERKGHDQFSLNLIEGAAHTDGESCERFWGNHNILSNSTKTMGPGGRQDLLESQFDFWNWEKYKGMGLSLLKRLRDALSVEEKQVAEHDGFSENIPDELVKQWEIEVVAWDKAPWPKEKGLNPYELKDEFLGEAEALKEIAIEEEMRVKKGAIRFHKMSPGNFVKASLDLRDRQEKLRAEIAERKRFPTACQETKISDERSAIRRQLKNLQEVRAIYMPGLVQHLQDSGDDEDAEDGKAEEIRIWLPSSFSGGDINHICVPGLADIEARLEKGRAGDALDSVRHTLRVKSRMLLFKNSNVRGQRDSGRSNATIEQVTSRAKLYAEKYRRCRKAYYALSPDDSMSAPEAELPDLEDGDIRSYKDPGLIKVGPGRRGTDEWGEEGSSASVKEATAQGEDFIPLSTTAESTLRNDSIVELDLIPLDTHELQFRSAHGTGDTRKGLSWIWTHRGLKINVEDGADDNNELLRAEWCRSRARARRAEEEVKLVREEMRRTLAYLGWAADKWESMIGGDGPPEEKGIAEGRVAYAVEQAAMQRALRDKFEGIWTANAAKAVDEVGENENKEIKNEESEEDELIDDDDGYE
ncbi:hypothetical protein V5O48_004508 [Marasmius crinis-equi]|uniref:CxC2-like cysteine cluster KDZ transposase-associated domain-containing protein n=1 Tax=Marasmius crinis-equi TaxID=585013 RepID=A0ABR3FPW5_9AGAR